MCTITFWTLRAHYTIKIINSIASTEDILQCKSCATARNMSLFQIEGKIALITGGASGIGFEYAKALLRKGLRVLPFL